MAQRPLRAPAGGTANGCPTCRRSSTAASATGRSARCRWAAARSPCSSSTSAPTTAIPVRVYLVEEGNAREILYDPAMFDFGAVEVPEPLPPDAGFAGFRVHYVFDEGEAPAGAADLPRRQLFPRAWPATRGSASRRAGLALETGLGQARGVPGLHRFLGLAPERSARSAADLRAARQPERRRRLPLRRGPARRHRWWRSTPACSSAPTSRRSASRR